jgi:hypothetical protein
VGVTSTQPLIGKSKSKGVHGRGKIDLINDMNPEWKDLFDDLWGLREKERLLRFSQWQKIIDDQIDRLVYDLYGLTEEEIKIVEGTNWCHCELAKQSYLFPIMNASLLWLTMKNHKQKKWRTTNTAFISWPTKTTLSSILVWPMTYAEELSNIVSDKVESLHRDTKSPSLFTKNVGGTSMRRSTEKSKSKGVHGREK